MNEPRTAIDRDQSTTHGDSHVEVGEFNGQLGRSKHSLLHFCPGARLRTPPAVNAWLPTCVSLQRKKKTRHDRRYKYIYIYIKAVSGRARGRTMEHRTLRPSPYPGLTLILWWRTYKARLLDKLDSATLNFVTPSLRERKAPVMECGHVVILGWSPIVPALVSELCFARKEVGGTVEVLLTELCKIDVEDVLRVHINFSNSHVVVRTGDTAKAEDLEKLSVKDARTVLVVSLADHTRVVNDAQHEVAKRRNVCRGWSALPQSPFVS